MNRVFVTSQMVTVVTNTTAIWCPNVQLEFERCLN
jgi:hypothetical protein